MFSYENFRMVMQRYSEEKVKDVVYAALLGNIWVLLLVIILLSDFLRLLMMYLKASSNVFWIAYFIIIFVLCIFTVARKAGIALSESRITLVKFGRIGYREKEVYEVNFSNIKALTVYKIFNIRIVKISFIDNTGRFKKIKLEFSSFMVGPGSREFKKNSQNTFNRLVLLQKVIDKGDF